MSEAYAVDPWGRPFEAALLGLDPEDVEREEVRGCYYCGEDLPRWCPTDSCLDCCPVVVVEEDDDE